ncbi:hypothetical protein I552_4355 [Mycobacterium xenopi 3993]|nr:hypothetical protein I552_4355 [Mycobacterium xenopi 3993]
MPRCQRRPRRLTVGHTGNLTPRRFVVATTFRAVPWLH